MDQQKRNELSQSVLDFKCKKILPTTSEKSGVSDEKSLESKMACETPVKITEPLPKKSLDIRDKLPEKYRSVAELFDYMNCSLKLLGLRKKLLTFENVSTQMEIFTKRTFLYQHLAQLKYILPEALQIDKVLIHDKKTLSMKPDMKINILFAAVEGHSEVSDFIALTQLFSSRLYRFSTTHPEACDVPEAILPEPFNQRSPVIVPDELHVDFNTKSQPRSAETVILEKTSQKPCFGRRLSENSSIDEKQKNEILAPIRSSVFGPVIFQDTIATLPENSASTYSESEPIDLKPESHKNYAKYSLGESPLNKPDFHGDSFAVETPSQSIPRRLVSSCDRTHEITSGHDSTQSCKPAKRTLDFFQSECDELGLDSSGNKPEYDQFSDRAIFKVTEGVSARNLRFSLALPDEVEKPIDIGKLGESTSPNSSSCLVGNVALIHSIFKSVNFTAITKEQLVYKIIINSLDVIEKEVVEDQLDLLERRVPEWICKKLVTSGDILYNIKNESDLYSVLAKLSSV